MGKVKVYGGLPYRVGDRTQPRVIVCASSQKRVVELLRGVGIDVSLGEIRNYWRVTGNTKELAVATHEGVWVKGCPSHMEGEYVELKPVDAKGE